MGKRKRVRTKGAPRIVRPKINGRPADVWYVVWSKEGRSHRVSTGIPVEEDLAKEDAKTWLADWLAAKTQSSQVDPPLNDIIDAYLANREAAGIRSPHTLRAHFVVIRARLGRHRISALTTTAIKAFTDYLKDPTSGWESDVPANAKPRKKHARKSPRPLKPAAQGTINKKIRCLRQALKFGHDNELFQGKLPKIAPQQRGQPRRRFLSKAEGRTLLEAADHPDTAPHVRMFVYLALGTAQRMSAILELTWKQVDFEHGIVWFTPAEAVNKNRVVAPMSAGVRKQLENAKEVARTGRVIEYRDAGIEDIGTGFKALLRRAGLKDVRIHDLRRTAASWAIMDGASFSEVAALLGDDESVVKEHYGHFHPSFLKKTTDRIDPALVRSPESV